MADATPSAARFARPIAPAAPNAPPDAEEWPGTPVGQADQEWPGTPAPPFRGAPTTFLGHASQALANIATSPFQALHAGAEHARAVRASGVENVGPVLGAMEAADQYMPKGLYSGGWLDQPAPQTTAEKYAAAAGSAIGYSVLPEAGFVGKAEQLAKLAPTTVPRAFGKTIGEQYATAPGRAVAAGTAAAASSGVGQEAAHEAELGPGYEIAAGAVAPFAPVIPAAVGGRVVRAATDVVSPTMARWRANGNAVLRNVLGYDQPYPSGYVGGRGGVGGELSPDADFSLPPSQRAPDVGAQAYADQVAANQLRRAGKNVDDVIAVMDRISEARRLNSNSYAPNVLAPVDVSQALQKLGGSLARQSPEVAEKASNFVYGRQTGLTPTSGELPASMAIPTREKLAPPITAEEAKERYGTDYGASNQEDLVSMGMIERTRASLKRALLIKDSDYHGHAATPGATKDQILDAAHEDAKPLYDATYAAGVRSDGTEVDLRPKVEPVLQTWEKAATQEPGPVAARIKKGIDYFRRAMNAPPTGDPSTQKTMIERVDKAKQFFERDVIKPLIEQDDNPYTGGVLTKFKNDVLDAISGNEEKGIAGVQENDLGAKYKKARDSFSSHMEDGRAYDKGFNAWKQDSDVTAKDFDELNGKGRQKVFRLGYLGGFDKAVSTKSRGADITKLFDNERHEQILAKIIPKTEGESGVFSDRPQRFGRILTGQEEATIRTRNKMLGGSITAERLADDEALEQLHSFVEKFHKFDPTMVGQSKRALAWALNKAIGYRADAASALADDLFTADPARQAAFFARVKARMGDDRLTYFSSLLQQMRGQGIAGRGAAAVTPGALGSAENPHRPTSPEEADTYPSGTHFYTPDGRLKVKP